MPRRNRHIPHTPYQKSPAQPSKKRFATRQQAEAAAEYRMLLHPELTLSVYRDIDGGWYLTSSTKNHQK